MIGHTVKSSYYWSNAPSLPGAPLSGTLFDWTFKIAVYSLWSFYQTATPFHSFSPSTSLTTSCSLVSIPRCYTRVDSEEAPRREKSVDNKL